MDTHSHLHAPADVANATIIIGDVSTLHLHHHLSAHLNTQHLEVHPDPHMSSPGAA